MGLDLQLAKPIALPCGLTLPNRLVKAAMGEGSADAKTHLPTETLRRAYAAWAEGSWGMVLTGNVHVDPRFLGDAGAMSAVDGEVGEAALLDAWRSWAAVGSRNGTPLVMQINHPGRQSPAGAGSRGFFEKSVAPSALPLELAPGGLLARAVSAFLFGTPRAMTKADIDHVVARFATTARLAAAAGFAGVQVHAAHGYLLAQFLSPTSNRRTDEYGGSPANRARIVVEVLRAVRAAVPEGFAVGIKLNSADHQNAGQLTDTIEQLRLIAEVGVDFLEISGGSYEDPSFAHSSDAAEEGEPGETPAAAKPKSERTKAREAFFLEFARAARAQLPDVLLAVTGGFRTRRGMEAALAEGACDLVGVARPAALHPTLPAAVLLNAEVPDADARLYAPAPEHPWLVKKLGITFVGVSFETVWYVKRIRELGAK